MRLIDADKIPWTNLNDNPNSKIKVLITFAEKVNKMPTIKPKKGCWLDALDEDPCDYRCSECGRLSDFLENFCPDCGARMDGDTNG